MARFSGEERELPLKNAQMLVDCPQRELVAHIVVLSCSILPLRFHLGATVRGFPVEVEAGFAVGISVGFDVGIGAGGGRRGEIAGGCLYLDLTEGGGFGGRAIVDEEGS